MPSKYSIKLKKPRDKHTPTLKQLSVDVSRKQYSVCSNCLSKSTVVNLTHTKCRCGGTYQMIKGP